jgi:DNA-directed RNA polymerase alpha subunit
MTPNQPQSDFPKAIGAPATGALLHEGYSRLEQLAQLTEAELLKIHGVGPKAVRILRETLATKGLSFKSPGDLPKLAAPAQRALSGAGITRLDQLTNFTEAEIKDLHGIGENALKSLREALAEKGLSYKSSAS